MGNKPLDSAMDNVLAWKLGCIAINAGDDREDVGDRIDRGLILLRLLNESGFMLLHDAAGEADK